MELYQFQKDAVKALAGGKHILVAGCGVGKTAITLTWAERTLKNTGKKKLLVVTTASKSRTTDWQDEAKVFAKDIENITDEFIIISWHKLAKWVSLNLNKINEYVIIFDEVQRAKQGVSSGMGRAFLKATAKTKDWVGATGTPADNWIGMYAYFVAGGFVRNKTEFVRTFCQTQSYKGFMEIVGYNHVAVLRKWWNELSYSPDTSQVDKEMPSETHNVIKFKAPATYKKVLKTRTTLDGEFIDTTPALTHYLRQICFSKDKEEWVKDFAQDTGEQAVLFFNYTETANKVEEILNKNLPKGAKVWRIDGSHHDIPTAETIGKNDIVLCQWQSGSEALNLQYAHIWVSLEPHYSYSTSIQARGRIKRIGQKNRMTFIYLKSDNTIENDIYEILKNKGDFASSEWCRKHGIIEEA